MNDNYDHNDYSNDSNSNQKNSLFKTNDNDNPINQSNLRMMILLENFSDEQFCRYEMYRRSKFSKPIIKKLIKHITGIQKTINEKTAIALAGVAKVYVGQLIEIALDYQEKLGENGPLLPKHIREANRQLRNNGRNLSFIDFNGNGNNGRSANDETSK